MKVAIVGAGPAGSHLACELSKQGFEVLLFDARPAWEKPCGGGVTSKALREFEFLRDGQSPKQMISSLRLISASGRDLTVAPSNEFAIYSRRELAEMMRQRAVAAGAQLRVARVEKTNFSNGHWLLETSAGEFTADFLVGADGASSVIRRRVGVKFEAKDFAYALGWHVRSSKPVSRVDVKYLDDASGYLWLFPRHDHLSYGIASGYQEMPPARLKEKLLAYIETEDPAAAREIRNAEGNTTTNTNFYAAMIPSLSRSTWSKLKTSDPQKRWALIGDAAGFVDPITEEGIYYSIKSADLLAKAFNSNIRFYEDMWRREFGAEFEFASRIREKFYFSHFAGRPLTERMIQFASRHRGIESILEGLIAGNQSYLSLKKQLIAKSFQFF